MKVKVGSKYYEAREKIRELALMGKVTKRHSENEACYFCLNRIKGDTFVVRDGDSENYLDSVCYSIIRNSLN